MSNIKFRQNQSDFETNIRLEKLEGETFKGSPLSNNELDTNLANLNIGKVENDGSIPMSGNLTTPGIDASLGEQGFQLFNEAGDLVFTAGANNTNDVVFEGNIDVGDQGSLNMNLGGGDIFAENIYLGGRLIDQSLSENYKVSNIGDVLKATALDSPTVTVTSNIDSGATQIEVDAVDNIYIGDRIESSSGIISDGTTVTAIDGTTLTISTPTTGSTNSGTTLILNGQNTLLRFTTIVRLINVTGEFGVDQTVRGNTTGYTGTIHRIEGSNIFVVMDNDDEEFESTELLQQIVAGTPSSSIQGTITEVVNTDTIKVGHKLKIFGMQSTDPSQDIDQAVNTPSSGNSQNAVASGTIDESFDTQSYYYWVAQFRFDNGKIGAAAGPTSEITNNIPEYFTADRFNTLTLSRTSDEYGLLIYRSSTDQYQDAELIDVLGPKELGSISTGISYFDQGTFLRTEWSTKTNDTNAFSDLTTASSRLDPDYGPSSMVYFPLTPPVDNEINQGNINARGWVTAEVERINDKKTVLLTTRNWFSDDYLEIVHDNTDGLQQAINENRDLALRNIEFPDGVYYTSRLTVPSDFAIFGNSKRTIIKQIPWNFEYYDDGERPNQKGCIFVSESDNPDKITISSVTIDGNMVNQVLWEEAESNFLVSMADGQDIVYSNIDLVNSPAAGIYAFNNDRLRIGSSQILDGGLKYSDEEGFEPLFASGSEFTTVSNNIFENWSGAIDTSVSKIGTVVSNTIRNCGSGLLVYGSGNFLSSPNLIMGTDDEWIPSVDKLDSDYDSINIDIDRGIDYISPDILYMSGGEPEYLGSTDKTDLPGTAVSLSSDILALTKTDNVESLSAVGGPLDYTLNSSDQPIIEVGTNGDLGEDGRNNGYVRWKITANNTNELPTYSELKADWEGTSPLTDETLVGLIYRIKATQYAYTQEDSDKLFVDTIDLSTDNGDPIAEFELENSDEVNIFAIGDTIRCFNIESGVSPNIEGLEINITETRISSGAAYVKGIIQDNISVGDPSPVSTAGQTVKPYLGIRNTFVLAKGRIT